MPLMAFIEPLIAAAGEEGAAAGAGEAAAGAGETGGGGSLSPRQFAPHLGGGQGKQRAQADPLTDASNFIKTAGQSH